MDAEIQQKLLRLITRHESFLKRVNRMLGAASRGEPLPEDAQFNTNEVTSLDNNSSDLAIELTGSKQSPQDWTPPNRYAYDSAYGIGKDRGQYTWLEEYRSGLQLSKRFFEYFVVNSSEAHVGDKYTIGAAHVVVGSGASTGSIMTAGDVFNKSTINKDEFADQLKKLRKALRDAHTGDDVDRDADIGEVASAEKAARAGELDKAIDALKRTGSWVFDVATKIGVNLATSVLKDQFGMDHT